MDALLIAFFLNLLAEAGGRVPSVYRALLGRYRATALVVTGMVAALAANAAAGAVAGGMIAGMLTPEARSLFQALTLAGAGIGLLWTGRGTDDLSGWRLGPLLTAALGLALLGFGEGPAFLTAGVAAARADPWMAGIGGAAGGIAACLLIAAAGDALPRRAIAAFRKGVGILFLIAAFPIAMTALRLV